MFVIHLYALMWLLLGIGFRARDLSTLSFLLSTVFFVLGSEEYSADEYLYVATFFFVLAFAILAGEIIAQERSKRNK